ncbi:TetR/AcrR family transcriptional regulator [Maribacter ulvicola]|uniref:Transcriptional regulator, TetR family n=1 Tax=Maribacter ulvicola TaxID=228959 RepID=A0A1N6PS73_9FLAO|nr:TetR/AcrR family transcriptional regulator [Maribacter ulvicola]SIQ07205.1 transcriptional regulator, TetR family [Maribacter ulvicola]
MKKTNPKERVLEVASNLFREQGFNSTGVNQIIRDSNVAKASFYDHFTSKHLLATEYLSQRHLNWFQGLQSFVINSNTSEEKIIKSFEYLKFMNDQENFGGCVFLNMLSELKYNNIDSYQIIKNHKLELQHFFHEIIKDKQTSFLVYMLFESCLTESQIFRNQTIIDTTITYLKSNIL